MESMDERGFRILMIDDDEDDVFLVRDCLDRSHFSGGLSVEHARSAAEALSCLETVRYDVLLVDYRLGDTDGLSVLRRARSRGVRTPAIFLTGQGDEELAVEAMKAGAADYLSKSRLRPESLASSVRYAVELARSQRQREQAELELHKAVERYRDIFEGAIEGIFQAACEGPLLAANPALARILGYDSPEDLIGSIRDIRTDLYAEPSRVSELMRQLEDTGMVYGFEVQFRRKGGSVMWARANVSAIRDEAGELLHYEGMVEDITERKQAELRLRESEEQYRLIFDQHPQPMWVFDEETLAFLAVNEAASRHYGWSREEFLRMGLHDIRAPERARTLLDELTDPSRQHAPRPGGPGRAQHGGLARHRRKDESVIEVEISSSPIEFQKRRAQLVLAEDVTQTHRLQEQLLQAQKLEAVGRLAGGVAHDFNNLLMAVGGYVELSLASLEGNERVRRNLEEIGRAKDRAASLTRQLLAFSRRQVLEPRVLDLNEIVRGMEKLLRRLIGEDIELAVSCASDLGEVRADPGQMERVIMNLAVNARDAMPRGGRLAIETSNIGSERTAPAPGLPAGRYVLLAVTDTGIGMDAQTRSRIFEPFFTTKTQGQGSGLGLATAHGIIEQSGGTIDVESEPGKGSRFLVYLPRAVDPSASEDRAGPSGATRGGTETVLLVEDDALVRQVTRQLLEMSGFRVLAAEDSEEALRICREFEGSIELLLTDVVMPGGSGRELAESAHGIRPQMKLLYTSGYTDDAILRHGLLASGIAFLHKPFTRESLVRKVREVLDPEG
jgi:two-component system, cell cycle sensor histidine kinase and response regulator CckA